MTARRVLHVWLCVLTTAMVAASTSIAEAGLITYTEIIRDVDDTTFLFFDIGRDLVRARQLGTGEILVETDDASIGVENLVSPGFGLSVNEAITYSHLFIPSPSVQTFQTLTLTINAYGVSGTPDPEAPLVDQILQFILGLGTIPDDLILVDGFFVGTLVPGGPALETVFQTSTGNESAIELALVDNRLDLTIIPGGPGVLGIPDHVAVRRSQMTVSYLAPEPATVGLLAPAFLGMIWIARRRFRVSTLRY